jgi:hypothetical protein
MEAAKYQWWRLNTNGGGYITNGGGYIYHILPYCVNFTKATELKGDSRY